MVGLSCHNHDNSYTSHHSDNCYICNNCYKCHTCQVKATQLVDDLLSADLLCPTIKFFMAMQFIIEINRGNSKNLCKSRKHDLIQVHGSLKWVSERTVFPASYRATLEPNDANMKFALRIATY